MPIEAHPKYGTGEFPPPRSFDPAYFRYRADSPRYTSRRPSSHQCDKVASTLPSLKTAVLLCACIAVLLAIAVMVSTSAGNVLSDRGDAGVLQTSRDTVVQSTPRTEWRKGTIPCLYQIDPKWADAPYAEGTIATHGCGPTCLSMVYIALTGKSDLDPLRMAEFSTSNGFIDNGVTAWLLMSQGANLVGLHSEEVPGSASAVERKLAAGSPIICTVHTGDFTTDGHFIVLVRLNEDGTVEIRDPNSEDRTGQMWELNRVISQCDNLWAFSA